MCFDVRLPIVKRVYDDVGRGELDQCAEWLRDFIRERRHTPIHCVLDCDFAPYLTDFSAWLFEGCNRVEQLDSSVVIATSMGEFEINYENWRADATIQRGFDNPPNPYDWLANSDGRLLYKGYHFQGFNELRQAFEFAFDYADVPPIPSDTYTAACYLVFVQFLLLNRKTHEMAKERGQGLGFAHLFCHYGDLLYRSSPLETPSHAP